MLRSFGARDHVATVIDTEQLAPHFVRIRLQSSTLFDDAVDEPAAWVRIWFPDPDGARDEYQRGYTFSEADPESGHFAIDVVLHEPAGPASRWAQRAQPGWTVPVVSMGSTRFSPPAETPAGYLLIGDSASIPAMTRILPVIDDDIPIELYLERHDPRDEQIPLPDHPRLRIHWIDRGDGTALAAAVESRDWSNWYAWVATESTTLKQLRSRLRNDFGFPKSEIHAQAYWVHGKSMGKQRGDAADESADETADGTADPGTIPAPSTDTTPAPPASDQPSAPDRPSAPVQGQWRARAAGRLLRPLRTTMIIAGVLQALLTCAQLAPYVLVAELARLLIIGADGSQLWTLGVVAVVLLGVGTLLGAALIIWLHLVDARFARRLRSELLGKLSRLPLGWFDVRGSGSTKKLIQDDTLSLHYLVTHAVPDAVGAVVAPIAVLVYLFVVDWRLALVLLLPVLVYVVTMWIMLVQSGSKVGQAQRWAERMQDEAAAYLDGQQVVRIFGGAASSGFRARLEEYLAFLVDWQRPFIGKKTVMDLATRPMTSLWMITTVGGLMVIADAMPAVSLLPFLLLGTTFGARLLGIGYGLSGIRDGVVAARRLQVTLDTDELTVHDSPGVTDSVSDGGDPPGRVRFDRVGFGYRPGVPVLTDIDLELEPGTVTALVGPSGSGKSTLAALLARFHDIDTGTIRVGGRDVRTMTGDELYARVGFVFQDPQMVHASVHDNIALAAPDADRDRVVAAATAAQVHDRIMQLPHGYDTVLGDDSGLSGGEQQRLTIARAILADPPVLIMDEATAFADPESEHRVQQALTELTRGRTVLVIAHRLHTITGADRIVVLADGRIAEAGHHDDLLASGGRYAELWRIREATQAVGPEEVLAR